MARLGVGMSLNATRHNRKAKRPGWTRTHSAKPERPNDRKARNRHRRDRARATANYRGGLI